ncbi:hypothetical protein, conserved [Eimeria tenella]|uniref:Uncharacterized protein n=1 Tax=Eimeria tenella TaxID=5802 RepID=U6L937_EIMTE|nr:hypothetical protein, conserved [Eimeria tenella]CDJ45064.1 hypothetical protein, conserved [Eimeria tenella]|eukprot:XP_013235811.1 hypothetical protein, conserved [Eimeria tenella]
MGGAISKIVFQPPRYPGGPPGGPPGAPDLIALKTKSGETIHAIHIKSGGSLTLLYSHGNAEDILMAFSFFKSVSAALKVDLLLYEYVGYGCSSGSPSEAGVYESVEAAFHYLTKELQIPPSSIVAYGRSLGSGPSVHLCARERVGGLILQSALLSVHRVALRLRFSLPFDLFKNINKIKKVFCPVFCIHGTNDEVVPIYHGIELYKRAPLTVSPMWVEGAGHNNLEIVAGDLFFLALSRFLRLVQQQQQQLLLQQQLQQQQQQQEEQQQPPAAVVAAAEGA